jgi:hypothetical protein
MSQRFPGAREGGGSAAEVVRSAPARGGTAPDVGGTAPDVVVTASDDGGTPPDVVVTASDDGGSAADVLRTAREGGGSAADVVRSSPARGGAPPPRGRTAPDVGGTAPDALPFPPMRLAPLLLLLLTLAACDSPPAFPVPAGPPLAVALDVQFRVYTMGTWALDSFDEELGTQLHKYNMVVVDRKAAPHLVAEVNLGVLANPQAIDVYLVRDGARAYAGRVRVPDLAPTTLQVSAQLVAPLIARGAWGLAPAVKEQ